MPGGDRTGPYGMGPMTGRAAGYCAGFPVPGFMNPAWGRGFRGGGRGRGGGWRHRHWWYATGLTGWQRAGMGWPLYPPPVPVSFGPTMSKEQDLDTLNRQAEYFEHALDDLRSRIQEIESSREDSKAK